MLNLKYLGIFRYRSRRGGSHTFRPARRVRLHSVVTPFIHRVHPPLDEERCSQPPHPIALKSTSNFNSGNKEDVIVKSNFKKFHCWKAGQINIQSCSDDFRLDNMVKEIKSANLDIVCIQEMRRLGEGLFVMRDTMFIGVE